VTEGDQRRTWLSRPVAEGDSIALVEALLATAPEGFRLTVGEVPLCAPIERRVAVDQTNVSVVVGDPEQVAVVVKWSEPPFTGPHPAGERLRRLAAAGFRQTPALVGLAEWRTADDSWVPVVSVTRHVPGASDGWTWCVGEARSALGVEDVAIPGAPAGATVSVAGWASRLGELTAGMHLALSADDGLVLAHGDYHVGQILRDGSGAMWVIDFDGNPTLSAADRVAPRPAAYDVAGMMLSLENVAHVVRHHARRQGQVLDDDVVAAWTSRSQDEFLHAYGDLAGSRFDRDQLEPLVLDQIHRELAYANQFLPRWRYVPLAALASRGLR